MRWGTRGRMGMIVGALLFSWLIAPSAWAQPDDFPLFVLGGGPWLGALTADWDDLEAALSGAFVGDVVFGRQAVALAAGGLGFGGRRWRVGALSGAAVWRAQTSSQGRAEVRFEHDGVVLEAVVAPDWGLSAGAVLGAGRWTVALDAGVPKSFGAPLGTTLRRGALVAQTYLGWEGRLSVVGLKLTLGMWLVAAYEPWRLPPGALLAGGPLAWRALPALGLAWMMGV